jgi:hypothetical protein
MIEVKCKLCDKVFGGHKQSQVDYQIKLHIEAKHKNNKINEKVN